MGFLSKLLGITHNAVQGRKDISYANKEFIHSQSKKPAKLAPVCSLDFKSRIWDFDELSQKPYHDPTLDAAVRQNLSNDEKLFFTRLKSLSEQAGLCGTYNIEKNSASIYTVYYESQECSAYIGKICLYTPPLRFAVLKERAKRASFVFDSIKEAEQYVKEHCDVRYRIESRQEQYEHFMQILKLKKDLDVTTTMLVNKKLDLYLSHIEDWISYIQDLIEWNRKKEYLYYMEE